MSTNDLIKFYKDLPKIARIIIQIFLGSFVSGLYRIFRFLESKNTTTLIAGILSFVPPVSLIFIIIDLVAIIKDEEFSFLVD